MTETRCRICSSANLGTKPFGYRFGEKWLQALACRSCGIIFLDSQPTADELAGLYSKEYFEGDFRCGHAGSYFDQASLDALVDHQLLHRIRQFKPSGSFLEIGCAGGVFLNAAKEAGYTVQGVEFSDDAARIAREKFGLAVITGSLEDGNFASESFDVVFMGDVIEHLPDPLGTMAEINRVMANGGLLALVCPTQTNTLFSRIGFLLYALLGRTATVNLPPYHLFEYRPESLAGLLERCGFAIVYQKASMIPPKDVTLRGTTAQRIGKLLFQFPNYFLTSSFGMFGDRIELFAEKRANISPPHTSR